MVLDLIFEILIDLIEWIWSIVPDFDVPDVSGAIEGMSGLLSILGWMNYYLPVVETMLLFSAILLFFAGNQLVHAVIWLLSKAHVLGSGI